MIAFLGMYDMPALHAANDQYWAAIRATHGFGPDTLTRSDDPWPIWESPDLLFAQTCGYPYRARLHDRVQLVATPDYGLPGCAPGHYNSVFIARADDARDRLNAFDGARFAYNEALSQSGWAAPVHHMQTAGLSPSTVSATGAHAASAAAVAEGRADFAALDALTWTFLSAFDPGLCQRLRVLARTEPTPALPYITSAAQDANRLHAALVAAIDTLPSEVRDALHLRGVVTVSPDAYLAVPTPPSPEQLTGMRA